MKPRKKECKLPQMCKTFALINMPNGCLVGANSTRFTGTSVPLAGPPSQHLLCSPLKADGCHMGRASPYLEDQQERCQSARKHVICIKMQGRIRRWGWGWGLEVGGGGARVGCNLQPTTSVHPDSTTANDSKTRHSPRQRRTAPAGRTRRMTRRNPNVIGGGTYKAIPPRNPLLRSCK